MFLASVRGENNLGSPSADRSRPFYFVIPDDDVLCLAVVNACVGGAWARLLAGRGPGSGAGEDDMSALRLLPMLEIRMHRGGHIRSSVFIRAALPCSGFPPHLHHRPRMAFSTAPCPLVLLLAPPILFLCTHHMREVKIRNPKPKTQIKINISQSSFLQSARSPENSTPLLEAEQLNNQNSSQSQHSSLEQETDRQQEGQENE